MVNQNQISKQMFLRKMMEKQTKQALDTLRQNAIKKNTINIKEFINKYSILFKRMNLDNMDFETQAKIEHASKELLSNIDPYTPIILVDDNGNEVVTFPPIFYPVNELSESASNVVDKLRLLVNQHLTPGQIDSIYSNLLASMIQSQLTAEEQEALSNGTLTLQDIFNSKTEQLQQLFTDATMKIKEAKEQAQTSSDADKEEQSTESLSSFSLLGDSETKESADDTGSAFTLLIDDSEE